MGRRICIVGTAYPFRGGLAAYNERLARAFMKNGDEVTIYTFTLQYPEIFFPGKSQYSNEPIPSDLDIRKTINSVNPVTWLQTGKEIQKQNPDIVIIKYWLPFMAPALGTIARRIRKNKHSRIISILDNIIPHENRVGDKMLSAYFTGSVDGFIAMSKSVYNDVDKFDKRKPRLISPHPLYDHYKGKKDKLSAREELDLPRNTKYLLFFGFIRDYKGLDLMLKAMSYLKSRMKDIKLIVAGEFYTNPDKYYKLIDDLEIEQNVIMQTDFIPDSRVGTYFSAVDLVVQPYKSATQSGVTQIAYHFEKPMIVTKVGGLGELIPDGKVGYVVLPNEEAIADAIYKYFKENREAEFVENIKEEKKKYSWQVLIDNINELDQLIQENQS
ncbi:MAG: glycosyltransferase [Bacteroidales bacterium]|nr:glycosyltransferase [Bacteroidales bacterium]MCF8333026.1 glycosyltransferase [Bacteroidales bacterium]